MNTSQNDITSTSFNIVGRVTLGIFLSSVLFGLAGCRETLVPVSKDPFFLKRDQLQPYQADETTLLLLHFDGNLKDGSLHEAEVTGTKLSWTNGVMGQALWLDPDTELEIAAPNDLSEGFMVEAWVWLDRPHKTADGPYYISKLLEKQGSFALGFEMQGLDSSAPRTRPYMKVITDKDVFRARTTGFVPLRQWFHISFTYDPEIPADTDRPPSAPQRHVSIRKYSEQLPITIRVNGIPAGSTGMDDPLDYRFLSMGHRVRAGFQPKGKLEPGSGPLTAGRDFTGKVDELRFSRLPPETPPRYAWASGRWGDFIPFNPTALHPEIDGIVTFHRIVKETDESDPIRLLAVEAVPTFESIGLYVRYAGDADKEAAVGVRYRSENSEEWQQGMDLVRDSNVPEFRGSLLTLNPGTEYEIELIARYPEKQTPATYNRLSFTTETWSEKVPVAEERVLPAGTMDAPLEVIGQHGTPDGWIKYRPADGKRTVIDIEGSDHPYGVRIDRSSYVILEGITIKGAARFGMYVTDSHDLRIRRNEISHWGDKGEPDPDRRTGMYTYPDRQDAIRLGRLTSRIAIEDNFMHTPNATATCWRYGHPVGPAAMTISGGRHLAIRNNEMIGAEGHWFNNIIAESAHGSVHGGLYRDIDISGNFLTHVQDNTFEFDGGVLNCRLWNNRMAYGYREIALAPTLQGPSYIFLNLVEHRGDEFMRAGGAYKLGWPGRNFGRNIILHNTVVPGGIIKNQDEPFFPGRWEIFPGRREVLSLNNLGGRYGEYFDHLDPMRDTPAAGEIVFVDRGAGDYRLAQGSAGRDAGREIAGLPIAWTGAAPDLGALQQCPEAVSLMPRRNSGMYLWPANVEIKARSGEADSETVEVVLDFSKASGGKWEAHPNSPWIEVAPSAGDSGEKTTVNISVDASDLSARLYRGVVTFRTDKGLNRSLTLQARLRHAEPHIIYFEGEMFADKHDTLESEQDESAASGAFARVLKNTTLEIPFEVPRPDNYYVLVRARSPFSALTHRTRWSLNGSSFEQWGEMGRTRGALAWRWIILDPHCRKQSRTRQRGFYLEPGNHIFTLSLPSQVKDLEIDCIVIGNEPFPPLSESRPNFILPTSL